MGYELEFTKLLNYLNFQVQLGLFHWIG